MGDPVPPANEKKQRTRDVILEQNVNFDSLLLPASINQGLQAAGFRSPSPIQFKALPLGRCGFDLIVKSKSGTGKTLVFGLIALENVTSTRSSCQALILVPTREIAVQICEVLQKIGSFIEGLVIRYFIGGLPLDQDIKNAKLCHIAVGAPGRIKHLISLGALNVDFVRLFVLDEADKLMDDTFQSDINDIFTSLPVRKQLIAASATYPSELELFLTNYMASPTHVTSEIQTPLLLGLTQYFAPLPSPAFNSIQELHAKNALLLDILSKVSFTQCLVFCNYQSKAQSVSNFFNQKGWSCSYVSAAESQVKRLEAVQNLKEFKSRILFSTDLTARGIDAPNVDLVVNYDLPCNAVEYLHRMGRAGRFGTEGICINLIDKIKDLKKMQIILGTIGGEIHTIQRLPQLEANGDLEEISGVIPTEEDLQQLKTEIAEGLLQLKNTPKKKNKSKKGKIKERDIEEICENFSGIEASEAEHKRRKLEESEPKLELDKSTIFVKNRALLSATRVLNDFNYKIDEEIVTSIADYLIVRGSFEEKEPEDSVVKSEPLKSSCDSSPFEAPKDEPLKRRKLGGDVSPDLVKNRALLNVRNLLKYTKIHEDKAEHSPEDNPDGIFRACYDCILRGGTWEDSLTSEEARFYQNLSQEHSQMDATEDEDDDYSLVEEGDDEGAYNGDNVEVSHYSQQSNLEWVPVAPVEHPPEQSDFSQYFEDCSHALWTQGLTYETVAEFDNYFYNWRLHLESVSAYVQQNIYIQEMANYQRARKEAQKTRLI